MMPVFKLRRLPDEEMLRRIIEDAFVALRFGQDPTSNETHLAKEAASRIVALYTNDLS